MRHAELGRRVRELRRRHFGPRGKEEFARRLGLAAKDVERFEHGAIPAGDVLIRMCEITGEDLQWLLAGVVSRSTVVISNARPRHTELLSRLATALDGAPNLAAPIEAFLDLLVRGEEVRKSAGNEIPRLAPGGLIPVFEAADAPFQLPGSGSDQPLLPHPSGETAVRERVAVMRTAPAVDYRRSSRASGELLRIDDAGGGQRWWLQDAHLSVRSPAMFGVRIAEDAMRPMFESGDVLVVAPTDRPRAGRPALCCLRDKPPLRCRVWLGEGAGHADLGRLDDGSRERVAMTDICWALEVLFRVVAATSKLRGRSRG